MPAATLLKRETLAQGFFCKFCKILKTPFYRTSLDDCFYFTVQQLLVLYLAIIYSWQLPSSNNILMKYRFRFLFLICFILFLFLFYCCCCFFNFFDKCLLTLSVIKLSSAAAANKCNCC